ncbi:chitinase 1-like [Magnolia sinica]|uniref:chitinase 1-like n=1 Tax=Magnolia sinica TaxID=86752 RepID=UPI00265A883B|nr:chitinase 1-like [Magnolia sinica]
MASTILLSFLILSQALLLTLSPSQAAPNSKLFREYIGAEFNNIKFSDVPINPSVDFHFLLSFAIDYTTDSPSPTNGNFNIFWDSDNLSPSQINSIKAPPFDDDEVQSHYLALWGKYGNVIDSVNFQFYAYDQGTTVSQFLNYFNTQSSNYGGGKVLVSFSTDGSGGLSPENGFFTACDRLRSQGKLHGIFVWSADDSMGNGFRYDRRSQALFAGGH